MSLSSSINKELESLVSYQSAHSSISSSSSINKELESLVSSYGNGPSSISSSFNMDLESLTSSQNGHSIKGCRRKWIENGQIEYNFNPYPEFIPGIEPKQYKRLCPWCKSKLKLFYIDLEELILLCENFACEFPFGSKEDLVFVKDESQLTGTDDSALLSMLDSSICAQSESGFTNSTMKQLSEAGTITNEQDLDITNHEPKPTKWDRKQKKIFKRKKEEKKIKEMLDNIKSIQQCERKALARDRCVGAKVAPAPAPTQLLTVPVINIEIVNDPDPVDVKEVPKIEILSDIHISKDTINNNVIVTDMLTGRNEVIESEDKDH